MNFANIYVILEFTGDAVGFRGETKGRMLLESHADRLLKGNARIVSLGLAFTVRDRLLKQKVSQAISLL